MQFVHFLKMSDTKKKVEHFYVGFYVSNVAKCALFIFCFVYFVWCAYEISTLKSELKDLSKVVASISPGGKEVSKSVSKQTMKNTIKKLSYVFFFNLCYVILLYFEGFYFSFRVLLVPLYHWVVLSRSLRS